jgi:hypothetical protein
LIWIKSTRRCQAKLATYFPGKREAEVATDDPLGGQILLALGIVDQALLEARQATRVKAARYFIDEARAQLSGVVEAVTASRSNTATPAVSADALSDIEAPDDLFRG